MLNTAFNISFFSVFDTTSNTLVKILVTGKGNKKEVE